MITIQLTTDERLQFVYILPAQSDLKTLELVECILNKIKINKTGEIAGNDLGEYEFTDEEFELIYNSILVLDKSKKINFGSLSLVKKFLKKMEEKNGITSRTV
jgi:hypothetical protein